MKFFKGLKDVLKNKQVVENETEELNHFLEGLPDRDEEENRETEIPPGEHIKTRSLWVVEAYTPTSFGNLQAGLSKLGLLEFGISNLQQWIEQARQGSHQGWHNLGPIFPINSNVPFGKKAILPSGVRHLDGYVFQLLNSITCVVLQFVFDEQTEQLLEVPMNKKYTTYIEKQGKVEVIMGPREQKQRAILDIKKELRQKCYYWIKDNIPGFFSGGILDDHFPTCEFITLDKANPCNCAASDGYLDLIGLNDPLGVWHSQGDLGLVLKTPLFGDSEFSNLILAGNTFEILSDRELSFSGGRNTFGFTNWLSLGFTKVVCLWGLNMLLVAYEKKISKLRDSVASLDLSDLKKSVRFIEELQKNLFIIENEFPYFAAEYRGFCENERNFKRDVIDFKTTLGSTNEEIYLFEMIRKTSLGRLARLLKMLEDLRRAVTISSQTINTKSNLRIQRSILWLTVVLVVLTVVNILLLFFK